MNIVSQKWDSHLCDFFQIPMNILPKIKSCSEIYGYVFTGFFTGIPISGVGGFLLKKNCRNPIFILHITITCIIFGLKTFLFQIFSV